MEYACYGTARLATSNALRKCKNKWSLAEEVETSRFNSAQEWPCTQIALHTRSGLLSRASVAVVYEDGKLFVRLWIMDNGGVVTSRMMLLNIQSDNNAIVSQQLVLKERTDTPT